MKHIMPGYEKRKITIELYKHIATLSVACIAVIVTFLPQLKELSHAQDILLLAVLSFLLCVVGTVISSLILIANIESLPEIHGSRTHNILRVSSLFSILGFLVGVSSLTWLITSNLA